MKDLEHMLKAGAERLGLNPSRAQHDALLAFVQLLARWNRVYNLTAVRDPGQMLTHHVLDCLAALPGVLRHAKNHAAGSLALLDVGSGGGLPGVVWAIAAPGLRVDCVDAVGKKAAFVRQACAELGLQNLRGLHARAEQVAGPYALICCRAFAALPDFVACTRHALADGGVWLALKGKHPQAEIAALPPDVEVFHVEPLRVPGLEAERCALWMRCATVPHRLAAATWPDNSANPKASADSRPPAQLGAA